LAGPQLRTKTPAAWLQRFNLARLKAARPETVHDNLMVTFDLSVDELDEQGRQLYAALASSRRRAIHEAGIAPAVARAARLDAEDIAGEIDDLRTRALLDVVERHDHRAVVLHDLMREYMRHKLGEQEQLRIVRCLMPTAQPAPQLAGTPRRRRLPVRSPGYHLDVCGR
jgi:hypothetical protein